MVGTEETKFSDHYFNGYEICNTSIVTNQTYISQ